jgi:hypothetical protein
MGLRSFVALPVEKGGTVVRATVEHNTDADTTHAGVNVGYGINHRQTLLFGMPYRLSSGDGDRSGDVSALLRQIVLQSDTVSGTNRLGLLAGFVIPTDSDRDEAAQAGAARVAALCELSTIDQVTLVAWRAQAAQRSLYVLDVRTVEEYEAGHIAGVKHAAGGQLVQETDSHLAIWGARVVLVARQLASTCGLKALNSSPGGIKPPSLSIAVQISCSKVADAVISVL